MALILNIDFSELLDLEKTLGPAAEKAAKDAARDLSAMAMAHLTETVQSKLNSTRETYIKALRMYEDNGVWVINLDAKARWVEDGVPQHEMIDDLLKSPKAKTSKDGSKYLSVPFKHSKGPTQQTPEATDLTKAIKLHMKANKIPWAKIEKDSTGSPSTGLLHEFHVPTPVKTKNGPGQGWGPIGQPRQGATGIPFLQGVRVYQDKVKDKLGKEKVVRSVMTFRTVSSKMKGTGRWTHPGLTARNFFEDTYQWSLDQLENVIRPRVIEAIQRGQT